MAFYYKATLTYFFPNFCQIRAYGNFRVKNRFVLKPRLSGHAVVLFFFFCFSHFHCEKMTKTGRPDVSVAHNRPCLLRPRRTDNSNNSKSSASPSSSADKKLTTVSTRLIWVWKLNSFPPPTLRAKFYLGNYKDLMPAEGTDAGERRSIS